MTAASSPEDSGPAEKWGDFHLHDQIGHVYVSTMWDGVKRPEGPYETCVFNLGGEEIPHIHQRTRIGAAHVHLLILDALRSLQGLGVL